MRNSPCCLVCLFQTCCPLYHVVYVLSITSSSPELSQTSRSTVPHKTVLTLTTATIGEISRPPSLLTSWLQIQGFPLPTTLRTQESTVFRIIVLLQKQIQIRTNKRDTQGEVWQSPKHSFHYLQEPVALLAHQCVTIQSIPNWESLPELWCPGFLPKLH